MGVNCFSMHGMDMLGTGMRKTRHFLSIKFLFSYYLTLNHVLLIKSWILIENLNISLLGIYRLIPRDTSVGSQDTLPLSRKHNKDAGPGVRDGHGGGWSRKINAWHLYTLMVYL
jgi:hypothetical protein